MSPPTAYAPRPSISVIIITRNRRELLTQCLSHLAGFRSGFDELVLVDNASDDDTVEHIATHFPWVRMVAEPSNHGIMGARNAGARAATSELLLFLDDDGAFDGTALPAMTAPFADARVGAVGGRVVNLPLQDVFRLRFEDYRPTKPRLFISSRFRGGNVLMRKTALETAGFFPEHFFYGSEERDLTYRLFKHGYRVLVYDAALLLHLKSISPENVRRFYQYQHRNRLMMIWRNLPLEAALAETSLTLGAGLFSSLATGHFGDSLRGIGQGLAALPAICRTQRAPLTRQDYRRFKQSLEDGSTLRHRYQGLLRNVRMQRQPPTVRASEIAP